MRVRYDAVLFDLLTALLDSWSLWSSVAGDADRGRRWRDRYLRLTYAAGDYRPYEELVAEAAHVEGLPSAWPAALVARWDELEPWPEAPAVVAEIARTAQVGVVTNCSDALGVRAAARLGVPAGVDLEPVITAESAGAYKPRPEPYRRALEALGLPAERVLFVAGSPYDVPGAGGVGMPVWWHNRVGMSRVRMPRAPTQDGTAEPVAEHDTLVPLVEDVR